MTEGLSPEDCLIQSMPDASPIKWHLAHVTWFFETFLLEPHAPDHRPFDAAFRVLFNSYYVGVGERHPRAERGLISRPSLDRVYAYRREIDARVVALLNSRCLPDEVLDIVELGLHHEHQHQELLLTDLKHHLWKNPLRPVYREAPLPSRASEPLGTTTFIERPEGIAQIGAVGDGFAFDNELPRHRVWLAPFAMATRLVTCGDYLRFIEAGGYGQAEWWLSDGWDTRTREAWQAPLYWQRDEDRGTWSLFTLNGTRPIDEDEPLAHVSYYEAEAYARWAGARLPTEAEVGMHRRVDGQVVRRSSLRRPSRASAPRRRRGRPHARRRLAMDAERLPAVSRLQDRERRRRRVQRQVHDQPDGAARRFVRDTGGSCADELPQLLPAADALAVRRHPPRARPLSVHSTGTDR